MPEIEHKYTQQPFFEWPNYMFQTHHFSYLACAPFDPSESVFWAGFYGLNTSWKRYLEHLGPTSLTAAAGWLRSRHVSIRNKSAINKPKGHSWKEGNGREMGKKNTSYSTKKNSYPPVNKHSNGKSPILNRKYIFQWFPEMYMYMHKNPWRLTAGTCPHGGLVPIIFLSKWVPC